MDKAEEAEFVWALAGQAKLFVDKQTYMWVCAKIGAGEQQEAIEQVLGLFAQRNAAVPVHLLASLWAWVNGFVGSEKETRIRNLASRLEISSKPHLRGVGAEERKTPVRLVAHRHARDLEQGPKGAGLDVLT